MTTRTRRPPAIALCTLGLAIIMLAGGTQSAMAKTATKIGLSASTKSPAYNVKAKLTATLRTSGGKAIAGRKVAIQRWTGTEWKTVKSGSTSSKGKFAVYTMPVGHALTVYRSRFAGNSKLKPSISASLTVKPKAYLTEPDGPQSWYVGSPFNVTGVIKPRHASGSGAVIVNRYWGSSADGPWTKDAESIGYCSDASSGSTYTASVVIPNADHAYWRFRSYHADALHAATWSDDVIYHISNPEFSS